MNSEIGLRSIPDQAVYSQRFVTEHRVVYDNVFDHTLAGCEIIDRLKVSEALKNLAKRIFRIHDVPEVYTETDIIASDEDTNPESKQKAKTAEWEMAKFIFSEEEVVLWAEFKQAGEYLAGKRAEPVLAEAIIAKVVDMIEGNMTFHEQVSNWVCSPDYDPKLLPKDSAFVYTIDQYLRFKDSSVEAGLDTETREIINDLFRFELKYVRDCWAQVSEEKKPAVLIERLERIRTYVQEET